MKVNYYLLTLWGLLGLMIFVYIIILIGLVNKNILQPAKYSVMSACDPKEEVEQTFKENGRYIAGTTTGIVINGTVQNITITINNKESNTPIQNTNIMKHEKCHVTQFKRGDIPNCNNRAKIFNLEVECYLTQWEPDWFYNWKYD